MINQMVRLFTSKITKKFGKRAINKITRGQLKVIYLSVKMSVSSCSLSVEQMVLMKYASNTLRLRKFSGTMLMMVHVNLWVGFSFKCLAGSGLLFLSSWSFYRILALRTVSPIKFWSQEQPPQ